MKLLPTVRIAITSIFATVSLHSVDAVIDGEQLRDEHVDNMVRGAYTADNGVKAPMLAASKPSKTASALLELYRDPPPLYVPPKKKNGKNQGTSAPTSAPTSNGPVRPWLSLRVVTGMENITHVANGLNATTAVGNLIYVRGDVYPDENIRVDSNKTVVLPIPTPNPYDYFEQVCAIASQHSFPLQPNVTTASCDYTIGGIGSDGQPIQLLFKSGGPYPGTYILRTPLLRWSSILYTGCRTCLVDIATINTIRSQ